MKTLKVIAACLVLLTIAACSTSLPSPTQTPLPLPTNTPEPTLPPTPIQTPTVEQKPTSTTKPIEAGKTLMAIDIKRVFSDPENLFSVDSVTWEGDLLKMKVTLQNFMVEPTDHSELHFALVEALAKHIFADAQSAFEGVTVEIVSEGKMTAVEMLSDTKWETVQKIIDDRITTIVEWKREAEIFN